MKKKKNKFGKKRSKRIKSGTKINFLIRLIEKDIKRLMKSLGSRLTNLSISSTREQDGKISCQFDISGNNKESGDMKHF